MRLLQRSIVPIIVASTLFLVAIIAVSSRQQAAKANFDRQYPGFVEDTEKQIDRIELMPPGPFRDQTLKALHANLAWAANYKRLGFDPDVFDELAFEKELAEQEKRKASGLVTGFESR